MRARQLAEPGESWRTRRMSAVLGAFALGYYASYLQRWPFEFGDEGYLYYVARGISEGRLPYRDVQLFTYPAELFYLFDLVFRWGGDGVVWPRVLMAGFLACSVALTYTVALRVMPGPLALLIAGLVFLVPGEWYKFYVRLLNVALLVCLIEYLYEGRAVWLAAAGLVVGTACHLRFDVVLLGAGLVGLTLLLEAGVLHRLRSRRVLLLRLGQCAGGALLVAVPLCAHLFSRGLLGGYFSQWMQFFPGLAERTAHVPNLAPPPLAMLVSGSGGPSVFAALYYGSFAILLVFAVGVGLRLRTVWRPAQGDEPARLTAAARILLLGAAVLNVPQYAFQRPDDYHFVQQSFAFLLPLGILAGDAVGRARRAGPLRRTAWAAAAVACGLYGVAYATALLPRPAGGGFRVARSGAVQTVTLSNGLTYPAYAEQTSEKLLEYVIAHTNPADAVATLPYAPGINFLTKRRLPGRQVYVLPYSVSRGDAQAAYIDDLRASGVEFLVYQSEFRLNANDESLVRNFAPMIDTFIVETYTVILEADGYLLYRR